MYDGLPYGQLVAVCRHQLLNQGVDVVQPVLIVDLISPAKDLGCVISRPKRQRHQSYLLSNQTLLNGGDLSQHFEGGPHRSISTHYSYYTISLLRALRSDIMFQHLHAQLSFLLLNHIEQVQCTVQFHHLTRLTHMLAIR